MNKSKDYLIKNIFSNITKKDMIILKMCFTLIFALATGFGAAVKVFLPFTPVPITLQTFFVLLSGLLLGPYFGSLSQTIILHQ